MNPFPPTVPDLNRYGDAPSILRKAGSCHAPLWSAQCLDCNQPLGWNRLISQAMNELAWHQQLHRLARNEHRSNVVGARLRVRGEPDQVRVDRAVAGVVLHLSRSERLAAVSYLRDAGLTYEQVSVRLGISSRLVARDVAVLRAAAAAEDAA